MRVISILAHRVIIRIKEVTPVKAVVKSGTARAMEVCAFTVHRSPAPTSPLVPHT